MGMDNEKAQGCFSWSFLVIANYVILSVLFTFGVTYTRGQLTQDVGMQILPLTIAAAEAFTSQPEKNDK